jgi:integrase
MFRKATEWGVLSASPAVGLKLPAASKAKTRYLTVDEWKRLQAVAPPWLRPLLTITVATGMRLKEVVSLKWEDVDRQARVLHVSRNTKTGTRAIPLNKTAHEVLREIGQLRHLRSPYVFTDAAGKPYTSGKVRNHVSKATSAAMRGAGIKDASFHTLRHTAASWMVQGGVPLYEVQKILGHSTPLMTDRYSHLQPDHLRGAVETLDNAMKRGGPNSAPNSPPQSDGRAAESR